MKKKLIISSGEIQSTLLGTFFLVDDVQRMDTRLPFSFGSMRPYVGKKARLVLEVQ